MIRLFRILPPAILVLLLLQPLSTAETTEAKRVLLLYSEDKSHPAHELTDQGIRGAFRTNKLFDIELYTEYLDLSRFSSPAYAHTMADYLNRKYAGTQIDAMIAVYPAAVDFLMHEEGKVFPGVPIVACEIIRDTAENLDRSPRRRITTGVIIGDNAPSVLEGALRLRPGTRGVALVAGTAPNDAYNEFTRALESYRGKVELIDLTKLPMQEILARVGCLPPDTIVLYSSIFRDGANQIFVPREALSIISAAANQPVFGLYDTYMGYGIVGGSLMSFEQQGSEAAALTLRVLAGESPASIPFGGEHAYVSVYDWRELKRWGISEKALPPGSVVKFKSRSMWEEHRGTILGGTFFISIETLLIIGLLVNLRKRRRAEAETAASTLRYRTVADYTYDWEYWSAPDGTMNYLSPSCERITGYSVREFTDDPTLYHKIILPEDRWIWDGHDHDVLNQPKASEIQFRIRTKGGEIRWIDHACLPVHDGQGKFLGFRASNRDISEKKKAEFEVQQQRNELAHVTRVAALGELTSSIAHELNQPLAAIRNYANAAQRFLSQSEPDMSKAGDALEGIVRDDRRAAEVITRVRELLKKEEPSYQPVRMNQVIQEILVFIRSDAILKGLTIETELAPALPVVEGDRVQLQQVLLNLILNSVDAMNKAKPDLRKLVIKTENDDDQEVKVSVRDFGAGIDEAHRAKLFEPFFTTKTEGMGMGLAISQRIIHAHGGSIWAENNPGGGVTFYFTLPTGNEENGVPGVEGRGKIAS
jgi:PAS domain S-box-containing protein